MTNGVLVGDYRPDDSDEEIDIRVRYSVDERNLGQLDQLRVNTPSGTVPIANFVALEPLPRTGDIERTDGKRVLSVSADVEPGVLPDEKVQEIRGWLEQRGVRSAGRVHLLAARTRSSGRRRPSCSPRSAPRCA